MNKKDLEKIVKVLDVIDLSIQKQEFTLDFLKGILNYISDSEMVNTYRWFIVGYEQILESWNEAKTNILDQFPEVSDTYQPKQFLPPRRR